MTFESLPNETLLYVFECLTSIHLIRAFHGLNCRFNNLLVNHFRINSLDMRRVSKTDFDAVCEKSLGLMSYAIISMHVSDDEETPHQTNCLHSYNLMFNRFINLQSLTLSNITFQCSLEIILKEIRYLNNLENLRMISCNFELHIINSIWKLPKLIHLQLNKHENFSTYISPDRVMHSLRTLWIQKEAMQKISLDSLLKHFPSLEYLSIDYADSYLTRSLSSVRPSITRLNLVFKAEPMQLENVLQSMPNLSHLTVLLDNAYIDGSQWEKWITDYLPKLNIFRMKMNFKIGLNCAIEEEVDRVLDTFKTNFWIHYRQWFVRCHWSRLMIHTDLYLYTLPYNCFTLNLRQKEHFKSSYSIDSNFDEYRNSLHLHCDPSSLNTAPSLLDFRNVNYLECCITAPDSLCLRIRTDMLTKLFVYLSSVTYASQLQMLLDRAPRLYCLELFTDFNPILLFENLKSKSVRRLQIRSATKAWNELDATKFSKTPIGLQCEVLSIILLNQTTIIELVNSMKNLRALTVMAVDDPWKMKTYVLMCHSADDAYIQRLQQYMSSKYTIGRLKSLPSWLQVWIQ